MAKAKVKAKSTRTATQNGQTRVLTVKEARRRVARQERWAVVSLVNGEVLAVPKSRSAARVERTRHDVPTFIDRVELRVLGVRA